MRAFSRLVSRLEVLKGKQRQQLMEEYFAEAPSPDLSHALAILAGFPPRRVLSIAELCALASGASGIPSWLLDTCRETTGDLTEALSLVLPENSDLPRHSLSHCMESAASLKKMDAAARDLQLLSLWNEMDGESRYMFNRLISGNFRLRPERLLIASALHSALGIEPRIAMRRLTARWDPMTLEPKDLFDSGKLPLSPEPYDFLPIISPPDALEKLGEPEDWMACSRNEGPRVQLVIQGKECSIWSESGELLDHQYPGIIKSAGKLPDESIFEGYILNLPAGNTLRGNETAQVTRVKQAGNAGTYHCLVLHDLLKLAGQDLRLQPYRVRHSELCRLLEECQGEDTLALAEMHSLDSWRQLSEQAERSSDRPLGGALLIRQGLDGEGQTAAEWYSIEPELHKARLVLRHVTLGQRGSAGDIVELSLGAILGAGLITVCKVPASLPSSDVRDLSVVVKGSTIERIGPVRVLQPEQVFEVSFRGVKASSRHKSGLALIDPVLLSWCRGVPADTAVKLSHLQGLQDNP